MVVVNVDKKTRLSFREAAHGVAAAALQHRKLILRLAKREILAKYKGSLLGILWAVISPLSLLLVYTFVFSTIFHMRWGNTDQTTGQFALLMYSGLIIFNIFAECLNRAPGLMLENVSYIKKVVFPLEILPYVQLAVSLFNGVVSAAILAVIYPFVFGTPPLTILLAPLLLIPLLLLILGLSWFLSSLGVFLRDVRQIIGLFVSMVMFMSPIFYPIEMVPEPYRSLVQFGPLAVPMRQVTATAFWGEAPDWLAVAAYSAVSFLLAVGGYWWFMRTRKAFSDVV